MKSRKYYPLFQEKREEMDIHPLMYKKTRWRAMYLLEAWKERGYDQKYAAMVAQKRGPNMYAWGRFMRIILG